MPNQLKNTSPSESEQANKQIDTSEVVEVKRKSLELYLKENGATIVVMLLFIVILIVNVVIGGYLYLVYDGQAALSVTKQHEPLVTINQQEYNEARSEFEERQRKEYDNLSGQQDPFRL